jgi:hypothetical protein
MKNKEIVKPGWKLFLSRLAEGVNLLNSKYFLAPSSMKKTVKVYIEFSCSIFSKMFYKTNQLKTLEHNFF